MNTIAVKNGDIYLDEKGNLAVVDQLEALSQRVNQYLRLIRGEWALDLTRGQPYYEDIFKVNVKEGDVRNIFDSAIKEFSEVTSVENSVAVINRKTRKFIYAAKVKTIYGRMEIGTNG